jgi:hypothetical protein
VENSATNAAKARYAVYVARETMDQLCKDLLWLCSLSLNVCPFRSREAGPEECRRDNWSALLALASRGTKQTQIAPKAHGMLPGVSPRESQKGGQAHQQIEGNLTNLHASVPGNLDLQDRPESCCTTVAPARLPTSRSTDDASGDDR